jgi:hypothetical protein
MNIDYLLSQFRPYRILMPDGGFLKLTDEFWDSWMADLFQDWLDEHELTLSQLTCAK